jgi:uncharacterized membrane protein
MARFVLALALLLAACGQGGPGTSDAPAPQPSGLAGENEPLHLTGTEPFWGGEVSGATLTYSTPENQVGTKIAISRWVTDEGLVFNGTLDGKPVALGVTEAQCSDGMSDRTYPFTATLTLGADVRRGCAWSDAHPFAGLAAP